MHSLKKYYFINQYKPNLLIKLDKNISLIWRNKSKVNDKLEIIKTAKFCKKNSFDFYLSNNISLAIKLRLKGVYISASNYKMILNNNSLYKNFKIIGSAHNLKEIKIKKNQGVQELFLAPIFKDKTNKALGIYKLKHLFNCYENDKIALGGINKKNIKLLRFVNFKGFAGISYFE